MDPNAAAVNDIGGEVWPEGELPAQGGGFAPTLMPGIDEFTLPATIAQQWDVVAVKDSNPKSKTFGQTVNRHRLKFDKNAPLVIASGAHKDETLTWSVTTGPRPRGKADDPTTVWISDAAYLLEIGLGDKSRPSTADALKAAINRYAGKTVRLEHGLTAHCRPDKVRYIADPADTTGTKSIADPSGTKGCGDDTKKRADGKGKQGRFYTRDFKDPQTGNYIDEIECDCGAILRAFPSVERIVPPLGSGK